jgi:hypothetical protein
MHDHLGRCAVSTASERLVVLTESASVVLLDCDGPVCTIFGARTAARVAADLRGVLAGNDVEIPDDVMRADPLGVLRAAVRLAPQLAGEVEAALRVAEIEAAAGAEMKHRSLPRVELDRSQVPLIGRTLMAAIRS